MTLQMLIEALQAIRARGTHPLTVVTVHDPMTMSETDVDTVVLGPRGVEIGLDYDEDADQEPAGKYARREGKR
jgi:hypothetical protein